MNEENMGIHGHLRRLPLITVPNAIYYVTTCCQGRRAILDNLEAVTILREEWESARERHGWLAGVPAIDTANVQGCQRRPIMSRYKGTWSTVVACG